MTSVQSQPVLADGLAPVAPAIECRALSKVIDDRTILDQLDFAVSAGVCCALLGANGAGKSTLMKILAMLMSPSSGQLKMLGTPLTPTASSLRRRFGLIGHQAMLYRDLTAVENLTLFGRLYGIRRPRQRAMDLLELVGLAHRAHDPVKALSRGMTQRTAIARALMHDPDILLADEPFAGLDAPSMATVELLLTRLKAHGKTILLANHDIAQSLRISDQVLILRAGKLVGDAPAKGMNREQVLERMGGSR